MLLTVARLSFSLLLLSLRSMALGWFHSSLHCHPEQINVTMRKARAALFLRRANSLLESLSDLLYSLSSPKNTLEEACLPSLFWLGYGANYKLHNTLSPSVPVYSLTTYKLHSSCWLYFTCPRAFSNKKKGTNHPNLSKLKGYALTSGPCETWLPFSLTGGERGREGGGQRIIAVRHAAKWLQITQMKSCQHLQSQPLGSHDHTAVVR